VQARCGQNPQTTFKIASQKDIPGKQRHCQSFFSVGPLPYYFIGGKKYFDVVAAQAISYEFLMLMAGVDSIPW